MLTFYFYGDIIETWCYAINFTVPIKEDNKVKKKVLYLAGLLLLALVCVLASCDLLDDVGGSISDKSECEHNLTYVEGKAATCEEPGWDSYERCDKCGYSTYFEISPLGHEDVWHEGKPATCTEMGWYEYVECSRCDMTTYMEIAAYGHAENFQYAKAPTCTEVGWNDYVTCYSCDYTTYVEIPALGHDEVWHEGREATCTELGWYDYVSCNNCGYTTFEEIWSTGHEWGAYATCTTDQVCNICGVVGEYAYGHNPGSSASCEEAQYCQRCNELLEEAHGHDMVEYEGKAPTCVENGWEPYAICRICQYSTYSAIRATGHVEGPAATCTEHKVCTECNEILERAFGHVAGNYADCENDSLCVICQEKLADALGHNEVEHDAQEPTCTEIGWDAYVTCTRCSYSTYAEIPANGHDYVNVGDVCTVCRFMKASEGLAFRSNYDGTYYVSGIGECMDNTVVIPLTTPNGDAVVGIRANAFKGCDQIVNVILQSNIQSIGDNAFDGCVALQSITMAEGLATIGNSAFTGCTQLGSVDIPDSVKEIGEQAFFGCALTSITVGENNENYCAFDGMLFNKDVTVLINYCSGSDAVSVEIPETVTTINAYAFFGSASIESVSMASVTEIGESAFENCEKLDNVILPDVLSVLSNRAFAGCTSLSAIAIPELITTVPDYAFSGCTSLASVTFHDSFEKIFPNAFEDCVSITEITFPETLTTISDRAFKGCTGLTTITVPESAQYIGIGAFGGCTEIESVTLPFVGKNVYGTGGFGAIFDGNTQLPTGLKTVTITGACSIAKDAFKDCSGITTVILSKDVVEIALGAFSGCSSLENLTLPFVGVGAYQNAGMYATLFGSIFGTTSYYDSVAMVQYYTDTSTAKFYVPASLKNVTILGGELGQGAFSGCTTVENVEFVSITGMSGTKHFTNCTAIKLNEINGATYIGSAENDYLILLSVENKEITTFTVPESTRLIVDGVFKDCVNLKKVVLPENLLGIGGNAFSGCTALSEINLPVSLQNIGSYAFYGCESITSVVIPEGITSIEYCAFYGCKNLKSVEFRGVITQINASAFSGCEKLEGIEIPEGCMAIYAYAFQGCTSLEYVKLPSTVKEIKEGAFNNSSIGEVHIPSLECWFDIDFQNQTGMNTWDEPAFNYNSNPLKFAEKLVVNGTVLTELVIPDTVTTVPNGLFMNYDLLTSVTIPSHVRSIGSYAFSGCSAIEEIVIPDSVTSIGQYAFESCTSLKKATLPANITVINKALFKNCTSLIDVNIPSRVTTIGDEAFRGCYSLMSITLPASLKQPSFGNVIGLNAFSGCYRLVEIYNLSSLNIARDDKHPESWGYVAAYSYVIHTDATKQSRIEIDGDWAYVYLDYYISGVGSYTNKLLIAYIGDDNVVTLPTSGQYYVNSYAFHKTNVEKIIIPSNVVGEYDHAFDYIDGSVVIERQ